jgi:predicted regulator of Ras-like GTPase activity (Roadblock/LC7/MglB family)
MESLLPGRFDPDLTNLIVGPEESTMIQKCLERLMDETGATYSMLLDRAGQVLSWQGDGHQAEMMHLGALLAGTYASSQEMARLLKEENFRVLVQEGMREKIFTETVEGRWLLVVVFDHQAHLGLVKVLAKRATESLATILHLVLERNDSRRSQLSAGLAKAATDTIDLIFGEDVGARNAASPNTKEKK